MTDQEIRVGIDVGCKAHRVAIADLKDSMLEEFNISHTDAGFQEFFRRIEHHRHKLNLPVAVAIEGFNGYARPVDRLTRSGVWVCTPYWTTLELLSGLGRAISTSLS